MLHKLEPSVWASERLIISMFGFLMMISGSTAGPNPTTLDHILPFIGASLIVSSNAAWWRWLYKRDQAEMRLRLHPFVLDKIRNPAEEAAIKCGTRFPTMGLMLETLGRHLDKSEDELLGMVGSGKSFATVAAMYDTYFPDEYQLEFFYERRRECLPYACVIPRSGVKFVGSGDNYNQVRLPELTIGNDGQINYGHRAVIHN